MPAGPPIREIIQNLDSWRRWYRFQRAFAWAVHGLALGLGSSLAVALALLFTARLLPQEFVRLLAGAGLVGLLAGGIAGFAWPFPRLVAAREFDRRFGLQERISTALELSFLSQPGEMKTDHALPALVDLQIEDAAAAARKVEARSALPLRPRWAEILLIFAFLLCAPLSLRLARPALEAAAQRQAIEAAIEEELARLEQLQASIEQNQALTPEQRQALLSPLEAASRELQQARSLEEALSALNSAEEALAALESAQARADDLRTAGQPLSKASGSDLQPLGQALSEGDFAGAAQSLRQLQIGEGTDAEQQAQIQQLEGLARSLAESDPELSQAFQSAADALRAGDLQAAQAELQQAASLLDQAGQEFAGAQAAGQAAAGLDQAQQQLAQAGGLSQSGSLPGQGQDGQDSGQGNLGTNGAGQGQSSGSSANGPQAGSDPIQGSNGPGDGGLSAYEQVYAPQRLGGSGGPAVSLPGSSQPGDGSIGQGSPAPGQPGSSQVPYVEVFSDYAEAYYRAVQSGQVPVQLRDLVRQYFSSLEPK